MNISCIHCGQGFSITAEQLGKRGKCPHCKATIILPKSHKHSIHHAEPIEPPSRFMEHMFSGFSTVVVHLLILILLALIPWGTFSEGGFGDGEDVMIGQLAERQLNDDSNEKFNDVDIENPSQDRPMDSFSSEMFAPTTDDPLSEKSFTMTIPSMAGGAQKAFEIQTFQETGAMSGGQENFDKMISRLKRDGLDIVIAFDSTASMSGEISQVKNKVQRIGNALYKLIPKTRISICTYRDEKDDYVVKGQPLTDNLAQVIVFLDEVSADGGRDIPEAVDRGLNWAINKNRFRPRARKIILLFGDAPPHPEKVILCQKMASDFRKSGGVVSTVTCRADEALPDFEAIAKIGGGEAFLTRNEREIMTQLVVLVFGSQHRSKVIRAFDLMNQQP